MPSSGSAGKTEDIIRFARITSNTAAITPLPTMCSLLCAPEDLHERIGALKKQEIAYHVTDYIHSSSPCPLITSRDGSTPSDAGLSSCGTSFTRQCHQHVESFATSSDESCDMCPETIQNWRTSIVEWTYQVIDHYDFDREIVAISLNYFDRYFCKRPSHINRRTIQLVALTAMNVAIKVTNSVERQVSISGLLRLGRGYFKEKHIVVMENCILSDLSFLLHPPTPFTFVQHFAVLLRPTWFSHGPTLPKCTEVIDIAKFLAELAVIDYEFTRYKPSTLGLVAFMIAIEDVNKTPDGVHFVSGLETMVFHRKVQTIANVETNGADYTQCYERLVSMYHKSEMYKEVQKDRTPAKRLKSSTCGVDDDDMSESEDSHKGSSSPFGVEDI